MLGISAMQKTVWGIRIYDWFHIAVLAVVAPLALWTGVESWGRIYAALAVAFALEIHDTVAGQPLRSGIRDLGFRLAGAALGVGIAALIAGG